MTLRQSRAASDSNERCLKCSPSTAAAEVSLCDFEMSRVSLAEAGERPAQMSIKLGAETLSPCAAE
eukprot:8973837-Pyramimonas_sp.AAC.1